MFRNSFKARLVRLKDDGLGGHSGLSIWGILLCWLIAVLVTFSAWIVQIIFEG